MLATKTKAMTMAANNQAKLACCQACQTEKREPSVIRCELGQTRMEVFLGLQFNNRDEIYQFVYVDVKSLVKLSTKQFVVS